MGFRKFRAGKIFDGYSFREDDSVLVTDEKGKVEDIISAADAGDGIEYVEGILSPGLINCHCHLELSHLVKKIPEGTGLPGFVSSVMKLRHAAIEEIVDAMAGAEELMVANGIVAVGDICNTAHSLLQKRGSRLYYHNFIEVSGVNGEVAETRFNQALAVYEEFAKLYPDPSKSNSIVPHSGYSVSDKLWSKLVAFPGNRLFSVHNQEVPSENEWFEKKEGEFGELFTNLSIDTTLFHPSGKSSLQTWLPRFLPNQGVLLVHNVASGEEDILMAEEKGNMHWCLCVNANRYISGLLPPVELLRENSCSIVLGTDSLASNHTLDIMAEIKTIQQSFPAIPYEELLRWATYNGARALGISGSYGSFERGKTPGVIAINGEKVEVVRLGVGGLGV